MKHYYTDKKTGISYTFVGDVYLPNLVLPHNNSETLGLWGCGCPVDTSVADRSTDRAGRRDQRYLEHIKTHRKPFYTSFKMQCKLDAHLQEVDTRASEMFGYLVKQLAEKEGITEALKAEDMMAWVAAMNNISNRAREIVWDEIINH